MKFDHINISAPMPLLKRLRDFYCEVFSLVDGFRPSSSTRGYWLYAGDRPLIHLSESELHFRPEKPAYLDHIAFRLSGLDAVVERLKIHEVEFRISHIEEIKMTQLFFHDPAGNRIEANFINETL